MIFNTFPRSIPISKQQFIKVPRAVSFTFSRKDAISGFWADLNQVYILLKILESSKFEELLNHAKSYTSNYTYNHKDDQWVYPKLDDKHIKKLRMSMIDKDSYTLEDLSPLIYDKKPLKYTGIEMEELAEILLKLKGREIIFYTGAGISKSGNMPVWTGSDLKNELGIGIDSNMFAEKFFHRPNELINTIKTFVNQLFADSTTLAHEAIAEIVSVKPGIIIFTENYDLKHEATGSGITACHTHTNPATFSMVKLRTKHAKLLLTVGLSHDDVAIIRYIKRNSPDVKLICLALSHNEIPEYISENDYVIIGDCHHILPQLAALIKSIIKNKCY